MAVHEHSLNPPARHARRAAVATAVAIAAHAEVQTDPHVAWLAEWQTLKNKDDAAACHRTIDLENLISHTPATTIAGVQAQVEVLGDWCECGIHADVDVMLGTILGTLRQLAR